MSHPYIEAWKAFLAERPERIDSTTLGTPSKENVYLRNRLHEAFDAGIRFEAQRAADTSGASHGEG